MYGPAVRCKRGSSILADAVLHQCIRLLIGPCAPSHHGYQRACDLVTGQASNGLVGSPVFACAGKTDPPSSSHPLADLGGERMLRPRSLLISAVPFFAPGVPSFVPACACCSAPRPGAVQAGRPTLLAPRLPGVK